MFQNYRDSILSFKTAHHFIWKNKLGGWVIIPGLINLVVFGFFVFGVGAFASWVESAIVWECDEVYPDTFWGNVQMYTCYSIEWILDKTSWLLSLLLYFIGILIYYFFYKFLILMIYSPILSFLIEKVDQIHTNREEKFNLQQFTKDVVRGITITFRNLFLEGICLVALLIMSFIPVLNFIQPVLAWIISSYFLGFSMMDYALERERMNVKSSIGFIKNNKSVAIANGSIFQLINLVPVVGWMIAPTYCAVAAYFAVDKLNKSAVVKSN